MKPDAPEPPNPIATASAQTGTNVSTALANQQLNQVNQITPDGSLKYEQTGTYSFTDPTSGTTYNLPKTTMTQELSQQNKEIKAQQDATKLILAETGHAQADKISGILSTPFDPASTAPAAGQSSTISDIGKARTTFDAGGPIQSSVGGYGQQQSTFGDAGNITRSYDSGGDITRSYGPQDNFSADRSRVEDALMQRMNPQLQQEQDRLRQQLADQGIRYGSQAYTSAMDNYNRQANDARFAAVGQGGAEQQRLNDMARNQATFQNTAQQQAYGQNAQTAAFQNAAQQQDFTQQAARGQFANQAQAQNYEQAIGAGSFANAAQGQQFSQNAQQAAFENAGLQQQMSQAQSAFNAANAQRGQYMNEQYAQRNQPLNEISALQSQSQISNPNFVNAPSTQIPTTDVAGLINQNFAQQSQNYQQQNANWQNLIGGAAGAAAGYLRSDKRSKENIRKIGTVFSAPDEKPAPMGSVIGDRKELPVYQYSYKDDPSSMQHIGPMAQDVEKIDPKAVKEFGGVKHIDKRRVMGSILRAA